MAAMAYMLSKVLVFICLYAGFALYVLNRKSFTFAMPNVIKEENLDKRQLGLIISSQTLAYTISKFIGGVLADRVNLRLLFAAGLLFSGIATLLFTVFDSVAVWTVLWFVCGFVQGGGWPACAKILRKWCFLSEFGTWYSILSSSMNLAGSIGPLLAAYIISQYGWRISMNVPAVLSICMAFISFAVIKVSPTEAGFPYMSTETENKAKATKSKPAAPSSGWVEILRSPLLWVLCITYLQIYVLRTALMDWAQLYLIQEKSKSQYVASMFVSSLEVGGIVGSVVAGYVTDRLTQMQTKGTLAMRNPRMFVMAVFVVGIICSTHMLNFWIYQGSSEMMVICLGCFYGFCLYGPVALYGVMAIEAAPSHMAGTCQAIVGLAANIGAVLSGLPLSYVARHYDWSGVFIFLELLMVVTLIIKISSLNMEYRIGPRQKKKKLE